MKILVTGGAGYIGSTLVGFLLNNDWRVTVVDNFMYQQNSLAHLCHDPRLEIVRGDCRDLRLMKPLLAKCDTLIPLAALVGAPLCDRDQLAATSTNRQAVVDATLLLSREQRIVIPISNSGYGIGEPGVPCTEESPLRPISLYGKTKVAAEEAVMNRPGLNNISLRLATVFGMSPRMRLDLLVNDFVYRAVHDRAVVLYEPHFVRNYIHVIDVARAFCWALNKFDSVRGSIYNVGLSDANLTKEQLCEAIQRVVPAFTYLTAPTGEDPDKRDYIVSNAKIEAAGWLPSFPLDAGIRELVKGYQMIRNTVHGNV